MLLIGNEWDDLLKNEFSKEYYISLRKFLVNEYNTKKIYPPAHDIFNALKYTSYSSVKAVILGQDPYHGMGQAHGLCFSVKKGVTPPPSLKNIYKELNEDLNINIPSHGELTKWANNGVLLLNTTLTVVEGNPMSHKGKGWEILTDKIIQLLNFREEPIVFMLWGAPARAKKELITNERHLVLETVHPSPLSAYGGFFGCKHFSKANEFLIKNKIEPIDWQID